MNYENEAEWRKPGMWKGEDSAYWRELEKPAPEHPYHTVPWAPQMERHQMTGAVYRQLYGRCVAVRAECRERGISLGEFRWFVTLKVMAGMIPYESAALIVALGMLEDPVV